MLASYYVASKKKKHHLSKKTLHEKHSSKTFGLG